MERNMYETCASEVFAEKFKVQQKGKKKKKINLLLESNKSSSLKVFMCS